jgi:ElaB/YqjD/DUF883 family membrane-anchored ribosome-binding protein
MSIMNEDVAGTGKSGNDAKTNLAADVENLKKSLTQLRGDVTTLLGDAVEIGKSSAGVAAGVAKDKAGAAVDGIKHRIHDLKERGSKSAESFEDTIAEHPLAAAMIAFGAGFILAKLFSRR